MKQEVRKNKILEIIKVFEISKQEHLVEELRKAGLNVTQATVSRDIKDLGLIKVPGIQKKYKYALPINLKNKSQIDKFATIFKEVVVSVKSANNIIVIHTVVGSANSASAFIDKLNLKEILGCIAGDDCIIVIADSNDSALDVVDILENYMI